MKKIKVVHENTWKILEEYKQARNSDKFLVAAYMMRYHEIATFREAYLGECPPFESITRCRRKIQAAGEFQSDKQIEKARLARQQEFIDYALDEEEDEDQAQLF